MFQKSDNNDALASKSVTIIGPDTTIDGDVAFTGYLRVQGKVLGNITCTSASSGTTVVHSRGRVDGSIKSPNIMVGGQVCGPVHALESLEVQKGATLAGDARYQRLVIHAGGVVEGALMPNAPMAADGLEQAAREPDSPPPVIEPFDFAGSVTAQRPFWTTARLALAIVAAIAGAGASAIWFRQTPSTSEPTSLAASPPPAAPAQDSPMLQSVPAVVAPPPVVAPVTPEVAAPVAPANTVDNPGAASPVAEPIIEDSGKVVTVKGMEADKPVGFFFVETREAAVLYIKNRNETGEGTRLEFPRRTKKKISIAKNEVVRVAKGRDTTIFYQGRKAPPKTIESGTWISFVPAARGGDE